MSIIKFVVALAALVLCARYVPFGAFICSGVMLVALWKLVNG